MPRVAHKPSKTNPHNPLLASGPNIHPRVLKRNQACHQCRRRKLKCDAKRPSCSTCLRSHEYAVSHASAGTVPSLEPECTYDELAEENPAASSSSLNKYETLENRISELETLLRQEEDRSSNSLPGPSTSISSFYNASVANVGSTSQLSRPSQETSSIPMTWEEHGSSTSLGLIWHKWPHSLPSPELLRHLVDVFFVFHPHANRLFHAPTFLQSLSLSPTHQKFPAIPVLHAMCAIGSLYTAAVTSPPPLDFNEVSPDEIFLERHRLQEQRPDTFAEIHAKLAKESADRLNSLGENLFQVFQANILLTWFFWSHGRWVDSFFSSSHSIHLSVPLGLNICPPFHSISKTERPPSILPPARTVIEDETRRNAFWLAFATERLHGLGNGWAMSLDDQDVSQLLPVRGDQFVQGTLVVPVERQWAQSPDLLLFHHENQVDSFILYLKGAILISRVKAFNLRFRSKYFAGDPSVVNIHLVLPQESSRVDPRGAAAFIELDHIASSFRASFPPHLRNPINDSVVDSQLYTACLMPLVATVVLHDPHAEVRATGCLSALKILTSARAILDLIYAIQSTSYDTSLLDTFCIFAWFVSGRVLLRFLRATLNAQNPEQISIIRTEVDYIHSALTKFGQRIPLAQRYAKMLENFLEKHCGKVPQKSVELTFPRPLGVVLQAIFEESTNMENMDTLPDILNEPGSFLSLG